MDPERTRNFDAARWLDSAAPTLGLAVTPDQRPGVIRFLEIAQAMAASLDSLPLPDDALDLAGVFTPDTGSPG